MLGVVLAATAIVTAWRIVPLRMILSLATPIDIVFTTLSVWMFHGTLAGMTGAATGGLILALSLTTGRYVLGYKRLTLNKRKVQWVDVPSPLGDWFRRWWDKLRGAVKGAAAAAMVRANT